jgi:hypothetical protein
MFRRSLKSMIVEGVTGVSSIEIMKRVSSHTRLLDFKDSISDREESLALSSSFTVGYFLILEFGRKVAVLK